MAAGYNGPPMTDSVAPSAERAQPEAARRRVGLGLLFLAFLEISIYGFGGVLAWARRSLVDKYRLLDEREFAEVLGLCQAVPGGNIVNVAVVVGTRFRGALGALAALTGLLLLPLVVALTLTAFYAQGSRVVPLAAILRGIAIVAAGLVVATGLKLTRPYRTSPWALAIGGLAFVAVGLLHWPLLPVLLALGPVSVLLAWRLGR